MTEEKQKMSLWKFLLLILIVGLVAIILVQVNKNKGMDTNMNLEEHNEIFDAGYMSGLEAGYSKTVSNMYDQAQDCEVINLAVNNEQITLVNIDCE